MLFNGHFICLLVCHIRAGASVEPVVGSVTVRGVAGRQVAFRWERRLSVAYFFVGWNALLAIGYLWYRQRQEREITGDDRTDKINRGQSQSQQAATPLRQLCRCEMTWIWMGRLLSCIVES